VANPYVLTSENKKAVINVHSPSGKGAWFMGDLTFRGPPAVHDPDRQPGRTSPLSGHRESLLVEEEQP